MTRHKPSAEDRQGRKRLILPLMLFALLYLCCSVAIVINSAPEDTVYNVGEISPKTVTATRDIEDEYTTRLQREEVMQKVQPVYNTDDAVSAESMEKVESDFAALEAGRLAAKQIYYARLETGSSPISFVPSNVDWEAFLSDEDKASVKGVMPEYTDDTLLYRVASMTQDKLSALSGATVARLQSQYYGGLLADDLESSISTITNGLVSTGSFSDAEAGVADVVLKNDVRANKIFDTEATDAAKQEAANAVEPVVYKKGQNIVKQGEIITQGQYEVLNELGMVTDHQSLTPRYISSFLIMLLLFVNAIFYLRVQDAAAITQPKNYLSLMLLTLLGAGLSMVCRIIDVRIFPVFLPVIVSAAVLKRRTAIAFGVFISVICAAVLAPSAGFVFSEQVLTLMLAGIFGSTAAVLLLKKQHHRGEYVLAGFVAGLINGAVYVAQALSGDFSAESLLMSFGIGVANGLVAGLLAVGLLPIWEAIFSLATPAKLLELSNPGTPLLKRLMVEAPGTYHHCVMAANLAEAGCDAIGADSLLARVATYYHDVGKIDNPTMFKENQFNIKNPHDSLTPKQSADIIISHVKAGVEIAEKYKLPRQMRDIIAEHHGDTLVVYFYYKAMQESGGEGVSEDMFRYPGPKPRTRESGVVMLADSVEAAVRANSAYTGPQLRQLIEKTFKGKADEGQFDDCSLTKRDLRRIADAFIAVFEGANHERIKYPEDNRDDIHRLRGDK